MEERRIILVLKSGGDFVLEHVYILAKHLKEYEVCCISDLHRTNVIKDNLHFIPMEYMYRGWWAKMNLFSPKLEYLRPYLFLDLDTIVFDIAELFFDNHFSNGFGMLRDFYKPFKPASGIMWIPKENEKINTIWNKWIQGGEKHIRHYMGDQNFIASVVHPDWYWQDVVNGVVSFKPNKKLRLTLDGTEKLVCLHGKPRLFEAAKMVKWVKDYIEE